MKKKKIYEYVIYTIGYILIISLFFKKINIYENISYIILLFEIPLIYMYIKANKNRQYIFLILSILFVILNTKLKYINVLLFVIASIFDIMNALKNEKKALNITILPLLSLLSILFINNIETNTTFTLLIIVILFYAMLYIFFKRFILEFIGVKKELKYLNSKKHIFDYSPFSVNKDSILSNSEKSIRMIEQILESIKSIIDLIYKTISVQSVGYLLYDRKDNLLYTEYFVSSHNIYKNRAIDNKNNILYSVINNGESIMDNMYLSNPQHLCLYDDDIVIRSMIIIPIKLENNVYGLLYLDSAKENRFTIEENELVYMYASQIGKLLTFGYYAEQSKRNATYFSVINEIVHKMAKTLDYYEILQSINKELNKIFNNLQMLVLRKRDSEFEVLYQTEDIYKKKIIDKQCEGAIDIIDNNEGFLFLNNLKNRKIPLYILNKNERINSNSIIGFKLIGNEYTDYMFLLSSKSLNKDRTMLSIIRFIIDAITTAIEKANYYERMKMLAIKDGLTGVYNHRYFQEQLNLFIMHSNRNNTQLALIIMDIDYFKKFNDTYGHQIGDLVLKQVALTIKNVIRNTDFIARYGGEEFAIILNNVQKENIFDKVEELRNRIENMSLEHLGERLKITASFGVSVYPDDTDNKTQLIKLADDALYKAKQNGRNRVYMASKL